MRELGAAAPDRSQRAPADCRPRHGRLRRDVPAVLVLSVRAEASRTPAPFSE